VMRSLKMAAESSPRMTSLTGNSMWRPDLLKGCIVVFVQFILFFVVYV